MIAVSAWVLFEQSRKPSEHLTLVSTLSKDVHQVNTLALNRGRTSAGNVASSSKIINLMHQFTSLRHKALKSSEERSEYETLLEDEKLLQGSIETLNAIEETEFTHEAQYRRMQSVDFIIDALKIPSNPIRQNLIEAASAIVSRDVTSKDASLLLKRSLAGDQIELYQALITLAPDAAQRIFEENRHGPVAKVLQYAMANMNRKG